MNKEHFDAFDQPPYNKTSKTIALQDELRDLDRFISDASSSVNCGIAMGYFTAKRDCYIFP